MRLLKYILRSHWLVIISLIMLALAAWFGVAVIVSRAVARIDEPLSRLTWPIAIVALLVGAAIFLRRWINLVPVLLMLRASLPSLKREVAVPGLDKETTVKFDSFGIPTIIAGSRADALRALGFVCARDRLFQMDFMRRSAGGGLSEILGYGMVSTDKKNRNIGFNRAAKSIASNLDQDQRDDLRAYADGVNAYIGGGKRPFEFLLLGYEPEPWSVEDCILILQYMFQVLSNDEVSERMLTIMEKTLPPDVVAFLTPDTDSYTRVLLGGIDSHRPARSVPVASLASLKGTRGGQEGESAPWIHTEGAAIGSNCWAVNGSKTANGKAMLANDIHLNFDVPNSFYVARLCYEDVDVKGAMIPGNPIVLAGSNRHVAWGVTNAYADSLDLVRLEINPENPDEYQTPDGWKQFETVAESIKIKGHGSIIHQCRLTDWGPVCDRTLLGEQMALRWTALDPAAVDVGFIHIDRAKTIEAAAAVANSAGGPPLNVILADNDRIAYTLSGRLPIREGFDGSACRSWASGEMGWRGYIPPQEMPCLIGSPGGFLVSANNRVVGKDYPYVIGYDFCNSYRAHRIAERLEGMTGITEREMFDLQLDTVTRLYEFYRELALKVLSEAATLGKPELATARRLMASWDGRAEFDSQGLVLLISFRHALLREIFTPFLEPCREADDQFAYSWRNFEAPLRAMLTERDAELLPDADKYRDWDSFILKVLEGSVRSLKRFYRAESITALNWSRVNRAMILHPLSLLLPKLGALLNMPRQPLKGCTDSVCVSSPSFGVAVRVVVSPGSDSPGLLHMPCGQSGHPLSPNYDDQHGCWIEEAPIPFAAAPGKFQITLKPLRR